MPLPGGITDPLPSLFNPEECSVPVWFGVAAGGATDDGVGT